MMRRKLLDEGKEEESVGGGVGGTAEGIAHDKRHHRPGGRVPCL